MPRNLNVKLWTLLAITELGLIMFPVNPSLAAIFTFKQKGLSGEQFLSGTFTGEDSNGDNKLDLNELSAFDLPVPPLSSPPTSWSLNNLIRFEYFLGTPNLIDLTADKQVDINDGVIVSETYELVVSGSNPSSGFGITTIFSDGLIRAADDFSDRPVQVQQVNPAATTVPEPNNALALSFLGLLLLFPQTLTVVRKS